MYEIIRREFAKVVSENSLQSEEVVVRANPLSPEQAIGNPEDRDYPLVERADQRKSGFFYRW